MYIYTRPVLLLEAVQVVCTKDACCVPSTVSIYCLGIRIEHDRHVQTSP